MTSRTHASVHGKEDATCAMYTQVGEEDRAFKRCCVPGKYGKEAVFGTHEIHSVSLYIKIIKSITLTLNLIFNSPFFIIIIYILYIYIYIYIYILY